MKIPEFDGKDRSAYKAYRRKFEAYVAVHGEDTGVELWSGLTDAAENDTRLLSVSQLAASDGW